MRIGVAISGGGHRATVWGAGTLLALNDAGLAPAISSVASVSGGSITNGVVAHDVDLTTDAPEAVESSLGRLLRHVTGEGLFWFGPPTDPWLLRFFAAAVLATGSVGFQAGISVSEGVTMVMTEKGFNSLLATSFKMGGDASVAAEPRLFHRCGKHRQTDLFQFCADMDLFVNRPSCNRHRVDRLTHGVTPAFIHLRGIFTAHAQGDNGPRSSVDSGENPNAVTPPLTVGYVLIEKRLALSVGAAAILKPHERHQLTVFIDRPLPTVEQSTVIQHVDELAQIVVVSVRHDSLLR
jgi:hypothetical protein